MHNTKGLFALSLLLALLLAACAPQVRGPTGGSTVTLENPDAVALNRAATAGWHRMETGFLETGAYTTNALVDLQLPQGARWTLIDFSSEDYTVHFSSTQVPDLLWVVTPEGVSVQRP